jgi:hypothetical protein
MGAGSTSERLTTVRLCLGQNLQHRLRRIARVLYRALHDFVWVTSAGSFSLDAIQRVGDARPGVEGPWTVAEIQVDLDEGTPSITFTVVNGIVVYLLIFRRACMIELKQSLSISTLYSLVFPV